MRGMGTTSLGVGADERRQARNTVLACYLGWTLDAFDYFVLIFTLDDIARAYGTPLGHITWAIWATLFFRPVGAFLFGRLADRFGRKTALMGAILSYSLIELVSAAAPTAATFIALRAVFGVALGGEWGVGASLTMESIPPSWRGPVSGLLQTGYPTGYLLAAVLFLAEPLIGWRGMFVVGALPALLTLFVWRGVRESPDWLRQRAQLRDNPTRVSFAAVIRQNIGRTVFAVALMTAFNFFSHGSQDLYPKVLLGGTLHFRPPTITAITVLYNLGAMAGGVCFGILSQRIGRRLAMAIAALLALPLLPLFAFSTTPLRIGIGSTLMQFCIQGAWGVVPAYLNELSPAAIRATFPGLTYQLGNLVASPNANLQLFLAHRVGGLPTAIALVLGTVAAVIACLSVFGPETARDAELAAAEDRTRPVEAD